MEQTWLQTSGGSVLSSPIGVKSYVGIHLLVFLAFIESFNKTFIIGKG